MRIVVGCARSATPAGRYHRLVSWRPAGRPPAVARRRATPAASSSTPPAPPASRRARSRSLSRKTGLDAVADLIAAGRHAPPTTATSSVCPLYHSAAPAFAVIMMSLGAQRGGDDHFEPEEVLGLIERERVTCAFMVPTMLVRLDRARPAVRARYDTVVAALDHVRRRAAHHRDRAPVPGRASARSCGTSTARPRPAWSRWPGPSDHAARPGTIGRRAARQRDPPPRRRRPRGAGRRGRRALRRATRC